MTRAAVFALLAPFACGNERGEIVVQPDVDAGADAAVGELIGPLLTRVRVRERAADGGIDEGQVAFGAELDPDGDGAVSQAIARANFISLTFDRTLLASRLVEIVCTDRTFSEIPDDATFDDIALCAPLSDGPCTAVCQDSAIVDDDRDGRPDFYNVRFYDDGLPAAWIRCDGVDSDNMLMRGDVIEDASGRPAMDTLLILEPVALRTSSECSVQLREELVGMDGGRACIPEGGDASEPCTPGEVEATFGSEPLFVLTSNPKDGATDVALTDLSGGDKELLVLFEVAVTTNQAAFTLLENGVERPALFDFRGRAVTTSLAGGLLPSATYTLTIDDSLEDALGAPLPAPVSISFTTAAQ